MKMNPLGRTGLFVSELCLGAMTFGGEDGMWKRVGGLDAGEAEALVGRALDAGINFIDTADVYAKGRSEEMVGQALRSLKVAREDVVVATKVYAPMGEGANSRGLTRAHILDGCKASLKRLELDHIDLYQVHGFDPATPMEETVRALDTLVQHGHVRYVGVSNWAAWQIMKALGIAEREMRARFQCLQAFYTVASRDLERDVVPMLMSEGVGLMVWSPLSGGLLTGKYDRDGRSKEGGRLGEGDNAFVDKDRAFACVEAMREIAHTRGASVAQVALAWLLHQPVVTSVIIGARRRDQLDDNLKSVDIELSEDELARLDEVSRLPPEYPGWMIASQSARAKQLAAAGRGARR